MKVNGICHKNMEMVLNHMQMEIFMLVISEKINMMEQENTYGKTVVLIQASLKTGKSMVLENG
jgi:hypothetical protein